MLPNVLVHPVHFEDFDGRNFERLVMAYLINKFPKSKFKWLGIVGHDEGRDIWGEDEFGEKYCYQCTKTTLTKEKIFSDIDKICKARTGIPNYLVVITGGIISSILYEKIEIYSESKGIQVCECWQGAQFEEYLRRDFEILLKRFCNGEIFPDSPKELKHLIEEADPNPDRIDEILTTNLIPIKRFPSYIYSCPANMDLGAKIFQDLENPPPFTLKNGRLYTFTPFNEENPLKNYVKEISIEIIDVKNIKDDEDQRNTLIRLINSWTRWVCFGSGLARDERTGRFFKVSPDGTTIEKAWSGEKKKGTRNIVTRYEKDDNLIIISHQAINLRTFWFNEELFIIILLEWIFSMDGSNPIDGEGHKRWERKFRKSEYSRNSHSRLGVLFWYELLFLKFEEKKPKGLEKWFVQKSPDPQAVVIGDPLKIKVKFGIDEAKLKSYKEDFEPFDLDEILNGADEEDEL